MKILHTADVHLHANHPRRLKALERVLELGREQEIDLLLIAGDLFDDNQQALALRDQSRRLFSNLPYKVLTIPGNHDSKAFYSESFFGDSFLALTKTPFSQLDFGDWQVVAVPYSLGSFAPLVAPLSQAADPNKTNILLLHCTWSLPHYTGHDYGGDDNELRYMPVTQDLLANLGYQYILAGHFHTGYRQRVLPCGSLFIYPGSPVSITSREQGKRSVNLVDGNGCRPLELDTWYHHTLDYSLDDTNLEEVLTQIEQELKLHPDEVCQLTIQVKGYTSLKESSLQQRLQALVAGRINASIEHGYLGVTEILNDPLYQRIQKHLDDLDPKIRPGVQGMLLKAFTQAQGRGE